jgi:hypothetical protein
MNLCNLLEQIMNNIYEVNELLTARVNEISG